MTDAIVATPPAEVQEVAEGLMRALGRPGSVAVARQLGAR